MQGISPWNSKHITHQSQSISIIDFMRKIQQQQLYDQDTPTNANLQIKKNIGLSLQLTPKIGNKINSSKGAKKIQQNTLQIARRKSNRSKIKTFKKDSSNIEHRNTKITKNTFNATQKVGQKGKSLFKKNNKQNVNSRFKYRQKVGIKDKQSINNKSGIKIDNNQIISLLGQSIQHNISEIQNSLNANKDTNQDLTETLPQIDIENLKKGEQSIQRQFQSKVVSKNRIFSAQGQSIFSSVDLNVPHTKSQKTNKGQRPRSNWKKSKKQNTINRKKNDRQQGDKYVLLQNLSKNAQIKFTHRIKSILESERNSGIHVEENRRIINNNNVGLKTFRL